MISENRATKSARAIDRADIASRPLKPYEVMDPTPVPGIDVLERQVRSALATAWKRDGVDIPSLDPPIDWSRGNRSQQFHLHAWDPISPLLMLYNATGDRQWLDRAFPYAWDWVKSHSIFGMLPADVLQGQGDNEVFSWYDMAVGQRIFRIAYLVDVLARLPDFDDEVIDALWRQLCFHADALAQPAFFQSHSNHGLYQALGLYTAARRFGWAPRLRAHFFRAEEMLAEIMRGQFFESGVHREHSPGYHFMVLQSLLGARRSGIIEPRSEVGRMLERAEDVLSWMITPHQKLPLIGDTDPRALGRETVDYTLFTNPHVRYVASRGSEGEPLRDGMAAYPEAGYAFVRAGRSYLAQMAGFHSRVHKHADHLGFMWQEGDREILADPGRHSYLRDGPMPKEMAKQGFYYSHPHRIYVERTRAHNCVEIDGQDYSRRAKPFGSALQFAREQDGLFVTDCDLRHPQSTIRQRRTLVFSPAKFLLVLDWMHDGSGEEHDYRQWFTLGSTWRLEKAGEGYVSVDGELGVCELLGATPGEVACGQTDPMQGWVSDRPLSLIPAPSINFHRRAARASFATVISLEGPVTPLPTTRANVTLSAARLAWSAGGTSHEINLRRVDDQVEVTQR